MLRSAFLNNEYSIRRSNLLVIVARMHFTLPVILLLLAAFSWDWSHAQSGSGVDPMNASAPGSGPHVRNQSPVVDGFDGTREEPHELSTFFIIGISINVVVLLLFGAWAVKEWKKNKEKTAGFDK